MAKPGTLPEWNTNQAGGNTVAPSAGVKSDGVQPGDKLPAQWLNWALSWLWKWAVYLDGLTGEALTWTVDQTFGGKIKASTGTDLRFEADTGKRITIKPGVSINDAALTPGGSATSSDAVIVQGNGSACGVSAYAMIRTTDATATTVYTYTVPTNKAISVSIRATAINSGHTAGAVFWIADGVINNAGALSAIGAFPVNLITAQDDIGAFGILPDITGAPNYGIKISGKAATTIDWIVQIQIDIVN